MENLFEERIVEYPYDAAVEGAIAEGNTWIPSTKDARVVDDAELDEDEVAELYLAEIVNRNDVPIAGLWFKLDNALEVDDEIFVPGTSEINMLPPWQRARNKQLIRFGKPASTNLLESTTLKYKKSCRPVVLAGTGGIGNDFTIKLHSYVYKPAAFGMRGVFGTLNGIISIVDATRNRTLSLTKLDLAGKVVSPDIWDLLPGGRSQSTPKVFPLMRYAYNAKATVVNKDYNFDYDAAEVSEARRDLWFEPKDDKIIIIEALGVKPVGDSHFTALKISGGYMPSAKFYTKGAVGIVPEVNPLFFGNANLWLGLGYDEFIVPPRLADPHVIMATSTGVPGGYKESGGVIHQTSVAVAANNICVAVAGKVIEMR